MILIRHRVSSFIEALSFYRWRKPRVTLNSLGFPLPLVPWPSKLKKLLKNLKNVYNIKNLNNSPYEKSKLPFKLKEFPFYCLWNEITHHSPEFHK